VRQFPPDWFGRTRTAPTTTLRVVPRPQGGRRRGGAGRLLLRRGRGTLRSRVEGADRVQPLRSGAKRALILLALSVALAGCDQSMTQQKKYNPLSRADLWADGTAARPLPEGTVARGDGARQDAIDHRPPMSAALLARGQERFNIYCSPCHGLGGMGDGMIVQRGFPPPPSFSSPRLRAASAQHVFDVITQGYGVMYSYAARVEPDDRWAIVAYVRALQASGGVALADVPDAKEKLP
jgi:mono/diheme cytochrome c family protein